MAADSDDLLAAIKDVKRAVQEKTTTASALVWVLLAGLVFSWLDSAWHSKLRYAIEYDVSSSKVTIDEVPHDCAFLAAPVGEKYCHHERIIQAESQGGKYEPGAVRLVPRLVGS